MVAGVILAAGLSRRMGDENKLTRIWQGKPLVCHVYEAAKASRLDQVLIVTGHEANIVQQVLPGARIVQNQDYESGMGSSVVAGVNALEQENGVLIMLGDMPLVSADHIDALLDAFDDDADAIVVAAHRGKPGNPVLFGRNHFADLKCLSGDRGARKLIKQSKNLRLVETGEAALRDFDTSEAFADG